MDTRTLFRPGNVIVIDTIERMIREELHLDVYFYVIGVYADGREVEIYADDVENTFVTHGAEIGEAIGVPPVSHMCCCRSLRAGMKSLNQRLIWELFSYVQSIYLK